MKRFQTFSQQKNKLKELKYGGGRFYPTVRDINEWFTIINRYVFNNQLREFDKVYIRTYQDAHAYFHSWTDENERDRTMLEMAKSFKDKKLFVEILAHEMIHLYQHQHNEGEGQDHGPTFRKWRERFIQNGLAFRKGNI